MGGKKCLKVMSMESAAAMIKDYSIVWVVCSVVKINEPSKFLEALEERFLSTGYPKNLTLCHSSGIGDRNGAGADRFSHDGMVKCVIGSHWPWSPRISKMAFDNKIEAYTLPQGVMVQMARAIAGGKPGFSLMLG